MPSVTDANLTLTESEGTVTIRVRFNAHFTPFERQLADMGMEFHSHTTVHGMDPGGDSLTGAEIEEAHFQTFHFAVTPGTVEQVIFSDHSIEVDRSVLQEDTAGERDEIRCKIRIHSVGLPPEFSLDEFTDQETLLG
jgi:hypothetical protein